MTREGDVQRIWWNEWYEEGALSDVGCRDRRAARLRQQVPGTDHMTELYYCGDIAWHHKNIVFGILEPMLPNTF